MHFFYEKHLKTSDYLSQITPCFLLIIETFFQHDLLDLVVDSCFSERNWFWQRQRKHIIIQIIFGLVDGLDHNARRKPKNQLILHSLVSLFLSVITY